MVPIALTIAGSDSGGGAGIQADLATFQAFGVHGTSVVTAVTAQNTREVAGVHVIPAAFVRLQLRTVLQDLPPAAVKSGMLATAENVSAVADALEATPAPAYVLDPVLVATSGTHLLDPDGVGVVMRRLLPLATLLTPNLDEAEVLTGREVRDEAAMRSAARALAEAGAGAVLVKGGHLEGDALVDVLYDRRDMRVWRRPRLQVPGGHGTGCTLSAAIAAGLAHGRPLVPAVEDALAYLQRALRAAPGLGGGRGPLDHAVPAASSDELSG